MLYRYIFVLIDEGQRMYRARALRSFQGRGTDMKTFGHLIGGLLLRTLDRGQRIHLAMLCRGFDGTIRIRRAPRLITRDILLFVLAWPHPSSPCAATIARCCSVSYSQDLPMSHHIVEVQDLSHTYPDGTAAVRGISFRIHHGESVAVVGANGAGKSTLLLHLNGYLTPQAGTVRIGDFPLTKATLRDIRRTVGMVFQDPDDQLFMPTVYEDVAFGPLNLGLPPDEVELRVQQALARVGRCTSPGTPAL